MGNWNTWVSRKPLTAHQSEIFSIDKAVTGKVSRWTGGQGGVTYKDKQG
jgi:hypothetical protein